MLVHGTSPRLKDSDDDGFSDGAEVTAGTDPKDGASAPEQLPAVRISSVQVDGATVTVTLLGLVGDTDHWHVSLDQPLALAGPAGGISVEDGLVHTFEAVPPGSHTIYAGPVGEDHALVGDAVSHTFNVLNTTGPVVSVTFGSDFAGEDGSIFTTSDGKGLDSTNAGLLAFGYFNTGFDVTAAAGLSDTSGLISQFNLLQSSSFDSVASPGFLTAGGTYVENGVDSRPYLFLLTGVTDFSKAESATEYGLFSDASLAALPKGAEPVPSDYSLPRLTYDQILLGSEIIGGGFGQGNAYAAAKVDWTGEDLEPPEITLLGEGETTLALGKPFSDPGATANDNIDGDITSQIINDADDVLDTRTAGTLSLIHI